MKPLVILELANNHMGDIKHASHIINSYYKITKKYRFCHQISAQRFKDIYTRKY